MDEALDFLSYALLGCALMIVIRIVQGQGEQLEALSDDVRYLKDHSLTRDEEVRPT